MYLSVCDCAGAAGSADEEEVIGPPPAEPLKRDDSWRTSAPLTREWDIGKHGGFTFLFIRVYTEIWQYYAISCVSTFEVFFTDLRAVPGKRALGAETEIN